MYTRRFPNIVLTVFFGCALNPRFQFIGAVHSSPLSRFASNLVRTIRSRILPKHRRRLADSSTINMGQAMRAVSYDRTANEMNAIESLRLQDQGLSWFRLDDGVMGGQSETVHNDQDGCLKFEGTINTNGGGFCSIRTKLSEGLLPPTTEVIRISCQGDGKTYKLLLSDGIRSTFGSNRRSPSWQADIPTRKDGAKQTIDIPTASFKPSWVFGPSEVERNSVPFDIRAMRELGLMLSLKLSDGSANPVETFGEGIFPFSFTVFSIEAVSS